VTAPFHMTIAEPAAEREVTQVSKQAFTELAEASQPRSEMVLLYEASPSGGEIVVRLTLYDVGRVEAFQSRWRIPGEGTLLRWNRAFVGTMLSGGALVVLWVLFALVFTGEIDVEVKRDRGVEREILAVRISRSSRRPVINGKEYDAREWGAPPRQG